MEPSCSHTLQPEDETRVLGALLDAFHPVYTLQEIASAYCRAGSDICKASEILCELQKSSSDVVHHQNDSDVTTTESEESFCEDSANAAKQHCSYQGLKPKKLSATVGSVSTILGKTYARPASSKKETTEATKPLKLEMKELPVEEIETGSANLKEHIDRKDTEEFLFSMLGDGFKLSMEVIQEVLGRCGYDVKKSMEELLDVSAKDSVKGKRIDHECRGDLPNSELYLPGEMHKKPPCIVRKATEPAGLEKKRSDLPRELLLALFDVPDRCEEEPRKRLEIGLNRTRVVGQRVVTEPLQDVVFRPFSNIANIQFESSEHDEDDKYWMLRRDAKEHWDKMKEFYEAAIVAHASGDRLKANDLIEEGRRHNQMAREADEKAAAEILDTKNSDAQNDVPLDLHSHSARESIRLLKKHLISLANIPMFRYLKVIVNTEAEDTTKGKRKRMVTKLLERESIKWTEEDGKPGTILIPLDEIDPGKLTFANDQ